MNRLRLAHEVAAHLVAAEQAIDAALQAQADLVARLVSARDESQVAQVVGDEAVAHAAAGIAALSSARRETVACHAALEGVRTTLGLPAVAAGQGDKDPPAPEPKPRARAPVEASGLRRRV